MFSHAFDDAATNASHPPGDEQLCQLLANEFFVAIAALRDRAVIGGITGYVLPSVEQARKELYLRDLAVAEARRRTGCLSDQVLTTAGDDGHILAARSSKSRASRHPGIFTCPLRLQ